MIVAYQKGDFEAAHNSLNDCRKLDTAHLEVVYDLYQERISELKKSPPGEKWDGVYIAKTK